MNLQAQLIRATALLAAAVVFLGAMALRQPQQALAASAAAPTETFVSAASLLPAPVVLATIQVRPPRVAKPVAERRVQETTQRLPTGYAGLQGQPHRAAPHAFTQMDMPYYSFGKSAHGAIQQ